MTPLRSIIVSDSEKSAPPSAAAGAALENPMTERDYIQTYLELFCHRRDVYAQQTNKGAYFPRRQPVTNQVIQAHLRGELTAGWYALAPDDTVRWLALDADRADGIDQLQQAERQLSARGIPSYLELSRRGGHLWMFCEPISAQAARRVVLGTVTDLEGIEVFPKQDHLDRSRPLGNLVRGAFGVHRLTGRRYPFVDPVSLQPISHTVGGALEYLSRAERLTAAEIARHLARLLDEAMRAPLRPGRVLQLSGGSRPYPGSAQDLKERIDLYHFISEYVELDASGRGHCPFHPPDTNPSFAVDRQRGFWTCFHEVNPRTGRYLGGDVIAFYMRLKGLPFKAALDELHGLVGDASALPTRSPPAHLNGVD